MDSIRGVENLVLSKQGPGGISLYQAAGTGDGFDEKAIMADLSNPKAVAFHEQLEAKLKLRKTAEALVHTTEKDLTDYGGQVSSGAKTKINKSLKDLRIALEKRQYHPDLPGLIESVKGASKGLTEIREAAERAKRKTKDSFVPNPPHNPGKGNNPRSRLPKTGLTAYAEVKKQQAVEVEAARKARLPKPPEKFIAVVD